MRNINLRFLAFCSIIFCFGFQNIKTSKKHEAIRVEIKNKNVIVYYNNDSTKQLTFAGADQTPILLNNNTVIFVRETYGNIDLPKIKRLMKVSIDNLIEETITDKKPFKDGIMSTNFILNIDQPTLSPDNNFLYFLTEKYATSFELVKVDLKTGRWIDLFDANTYSLMKCGQFKGLILVGKGEIRDKGRKMYYYLLNEKNEKLKEFESFESYNLFKTSIQNCL
ncbi:MAG: hypothetical protein RL708_2090 [Bacteroidota bacterium]|jgi:hypothetical protein